ncbi:hypothetical protein BSKO_13421 [Bryopsis sp. KO-2023]|nr:hypothetical protein BSKO_13421 [Bryopsis sp. KO-2023]
MQGASSRPPSAQASCVRFSSGPSLRIPAEVIGRRRKSFDARAERDVSSCSLQSTSVNGSAPSSEAKERVVNENIVEDAALVPPNAQENAIPKHVAIIMDGNGRWAKERGKPTAFGHERGVAALRRTVVCCRRCGVKGLTVFAFSTENWRRGKDETSFLLSLAENSLFNQLDELASNGVRLRFIGLVNSLPKSLQAKIRIAEMRTAENQELVLTVAFNYSGRYDIANAAQRIAQRVERGEIKAEEVTQDSFAEELDGRKSFREVGDPDLLIRTSGEKRLSNFLLWDFAYTELYFTDVNWPDFEEVDLMAAIAEFGRRQRRYGGR